MVRKQQLPKEVIKKYRNPKARVSFIEIPIDGPFEVIEMEDVKQGKLYMITGPEKARQAWIDRHIQSYSLTPIK
jgi:hypothetical protein